MKVILISEVNYIYLVFECIFASPKIVLPMLVSDKVSALTNITFTRDVAQPID